MLCNYSALDEPKLKEINKLEKSLGVKLLAMSCCDPQIARLDESNIDKIKALEEKIGVRLVAIQ